MPLSSSINRILIIGREAGPLVKLIKKSYPHMKIGSVDILGNLDTRESVESAFSVVKQAPGGSLERIKARSDLDLLYELTLIMLEEVEYDILIPLTPFNSNPEYLQLISNKISLPIVDWKTLEMTSSPWTFLSYLANFDLNYSSQKNLKEFEKLWEVKGEEGLFVTKNGIFNIDKRIGESDYYELPEEGFFLPIKEIHCAAFYSTPAFASNIGVQTITSSQNQAFFYNEIEKNAYLPFKSTLMPSSSAVIENLFEIIKQGELMGFITIYFGIKDRQIVPISCNSLPDEKIDLWNERNRNHLIPLLIDPSEKDFLPKTQMVYGYKYPIFVSHPIKVPVIPKELAEQRNIPGVFTTVDYPVCSIQDYSDDLRVLSRKLELNIKHIHMLLGKT
ncbi:MAG: hypothetical protein ACXAC6_00525 [Candidatus Hodarchaeales archaeon]|jgi:hypothetical protein